MTILVVQIHPIREEKPQISEHKSIDPSKGSSPHAISEAQVLSKSILRAQI